METEGGCPRLPHTHRSLLVSSHVGKTVRWALRQKYNYLYNAFMQKQQLGGRPKMPVAIPLHISRAYLRWKHCLKQPINCTFVPRLDWAFYRTLRPLVMGDIISDHCVSLMCHKLGFDSDTLHEFFVLLQQPSAVEEAQVPQHVQSFLQALHRDTWFQLCTPIWLELRSDPDREAVSLMSFLGFFLPKCCANEKGSCSNRASLRPFQTLLFHNPINILLTLLRMIFRYSALRGWMT